MCVGFVVLLVEDMDYISNTGMSLTGLKERDAIVMIHT